MSDDDYTRKQSARDAEYEREYKAWIESLPADQRRELESQGLAKPDLARHGNGAADHDMADSPRASQMPDIASLLDGDDSEDETEVRPPNQLGAATRILRHLVADIISEGNTRLTMECLTIALGMRVYAGDSMTEIANRHGITRAAVSKRCVDITERLNLPPSRAMRSEKARQTYQQSQLKNNRKRQP